MIECSNADRLRAFRNINAQRQAIQMFERRKVGKKVKRASLCYDIG